MTASKLNRNVLTVFLRIRKKKSAEKRTNKANSKSKKRQNWMEKVKNSFFASLSRDSSRVSSAYWRKKYMFHFPFSVFTFLAFFVGNLFVFPQIFLYRTIGFLEKRWTHLSFILRLSNIHWTSKYTTLNYLKTTIFVFDGA